MPNVDGWKRAFDSDPIDRKCGGVRRYQICRSVADPNFVTIDLEFDSVDQADEFHEKLRRRSLRSMPIQLAGRPTTNAA